MKGKENPGQFQQVVSRKKADPHAVPPGYKRTEVGVIPEAWTVRELGPLVTITSGESPSLFHFTTSGTPYFKVEQLNNSSKYLGSAETPYFIAGSHSAVPSGSIVFPKRGASIMLNKIRLLIEDGYMDTNLMSLTPVGHLNGEYLFYILSYLQLSSVADVTSIPQINNKHISPFRIPLPSSAEQRAIATALSDVDKLIEALDKLIAKKRAIKQATMQQLLTGKTRLPGFQIKPGYKKTEVGVIPEDWEVKQLGDVAPIMKGELITRANIVLGLIPVIAGGKQPAYFHNRANRYGKTITISASGAYAGYVAFWEHPIFASDCSTISEGTDYSIEFIYYQLAHKQDSIYGTQTGVLNRMFILTISGLYL